jgi:antitoxin CptB
MTEEAEARHKRLLMRSWRRGTKEMDLILGPYAEAHLLTMPEEEIAAYEALLQENDQDLYRWISGDTGSGAPPDALRPLLAKIAGHAHGRVSDGTP